MAPLALVAPKSWPLASDLTRWAYDFLRPLPRGATVSYAALSAALTVDAQDWRGRTAVLRAARKLLRDDQKLLLNVRGVGYRLGRETDHAPASRRYRRLARHRLRRAWLAATRVALEVLTPKELADLMAEQVRVGLTLAFERKLSRQPTLPPRDQVSLPSGRALVALLSKKPSS